MQFVRLLRSVGSIIMQLLLSPLAAALPLALAVYYGSKRLQEGLQNGPTHGMAGALTAPCVGRKFGRHILWPALSA